MRTNTLFKILSVFAAVSLAGCDVKDPIYNTAHPGGVVVTASNTAWDAGDCIGISASSEKGKTNYVNIRYQTDGTVFHPVPGATGEDNTIYFQDTSPTEFTAYHPCEGVNGTKPGSEGILTKEITAADQSAANLPAIDYLWARQTAQSSSPKVDFLFSHRMSRVILHFKAGDGVVFPAEGLTYILTGVATAGTFDTSTGEAKATGTASTLENLPTYTTGGETTGTAILWPQTVNAVQLQVTLNGTTFDTALTFPAGTAGEALAPATSYTFNVNVERAGIKIEKADIEDWTDGGSKDVTLQEARTLTYCSFSMGSTISYKVLEGATVVILNEVPGVSPSDKTFVGWNTEPEGGGEFYAPGSTLTMPAEDLILYALWSGDGSAENKPVLITDVQGMKSIGAGFGENLSKHYRLCNDLVLDDWEAIHWRGSVFFSGTFDGGGHTVTLNGVKPMVYISSESQGSDRNVYYFGLFAKIRSGDVRRLRVDGQITVNAADERAAYNAGGICGYSDYGSVTDCISDVTITVTGKFYELYAGGITGYNNGNIFNCYATGKIESTATVQFVSLGGIAGINDGRVANCAALNSDISGKNGEIDTYIWRITGGGSGFFVNNYASSTLTVSGTKGPDKPNGADCEPRPAASWWKDSGTWAASSPYTPWDFTLIWEVTDGNLPQLRRK